MIDIYTKSRRAANDQDYETWTRGGVSPTLNAFDNATETRATVVAFDTQFGSNANVLDDLSPTLKATQQSPSCQMGVGVRRLTPTECERLQGFPDGWTDGQSDSARYRQLGNAVTVPVAEWIGRRIIKAATDV